MRYQIWTTQVTLPEPLSDIVQVAVRSL